MTDTTHWYQKTEMIVATSAVIVSLVAVVVAVYSAWIDRSFARAATWPHIEILRSFNTNSYSLRVSNQGTGPAIIHFATLESEGQRYTHWATWLSNEYPDSGGNFTQSHISSRVLSPEKDINVFYTEDQALARRIVANDKAQLRLCYCSVFEECWITDRSNQPVPVDHCDTTPEQAFEQ